MSAAPPVSVCVPVYNASRFLAAALESALAQSWSDVEVVVSDNRSTDDTREIVESFRRRDRRIRYHVAPASVDMPQNFNRCLALATGAYVKFLCADDLLEPRCIERLLAVMEADPRVVLAACARRIISESGSARRVAGYASGDWHGPGVEAARRCFFLGNRIGEPTAVMFRRADAGVGFDSAYPHLMDLDMWFRVLDKGHFAFVAEVLCAVREHRDQVTRRNLATGRVSLDKERLFQAYAASPHMRGSLVDRLLWDFRMAWSGQRERSVGHQPEPARALFFPRLRPVATGAARVAHWLGAGMWWSRSIFRS